MALALLIVFLPGANRQSLIMIASVAGFHALVLATSSPASAEANGWVIGPLRLVAMPAALVAAFDSESVPSMAMVELDRSLDLAETQLIDSHGVDGSQAESSTLPVEALAYFTMAEVAAGTMLLAEGRPSTDLYLVAEGSFTVWSRIGEVRLRRVGKGAYLGEAGFFAGMPAIATVTADGPCRVLTLSESKLKQMYDTEPTAVVALTLHVLAKTAERLERTNALVRDLSD